MKCPKCRMEDTFDISNDTFENHNISNCFVCNNCNCIVTKNDNNKISNIYYDLHLFPD